jgi:hypothetical protein
MKDRKDIEQGHQAMQIRHNKRGVEKAGKEGMCGWRDVGRLTRA